VCRCACPCGHGLGWVLCISSCCLWVGVCIALCLPLHVALAVCCIGHKVHAVSISGAGVLLWLLAC
jgi:hypothetical protein